LLDEVPEPTKKEWLQALQARIREQADSISQAMQGTTARVLVMSEARRGDGQLAGRTENNRVVNFDGPTALIGDFAQVLISEALPNSLRGQLTK
jgi:tRNA-2-methylthio-N6-dimethylallyladenosine synthase